MRRRRKSPVSFDHFVDEGKQPSLGDPGVRGGVDTTRRCQSIMGKITASMQTGGAATAADHFGNCPICGALLDLRDVGTFTIKRLRFAKVRRRRALRIKDLRKTRQPLNHRATYR